MRYVSIDIETTGLDPNRCQIIEFAAVVDDLKVQQPLEKLPKLQTYVRHTFYQGEPYALSIHSALFKKLASEETIDIVDAESLMARFFNFLTGPGGFAEPPAIVVAGKNFATFDKQFIDKLPGTNLIKFHHRTLDPAMLFTYLTDSEPPSSKTCLERAGLAGEVAHTALEDALMVVKLLRIGINRLAR